MKIFYSDQVQQEISRFSWDISVLFQCLLLTSLLKTVFCFYWISLTESMSLVHLCLWLTLHLRNHFKSAVTLFTTVKMGDKGLFHKLEKFSFRLQKNVHLCCAGLYTMHPMHVTYSTHPPTPGSYCRWLWGGVVGLHDLCFRPIRIMTFPHHSLKSVYLLCDSSS